MDQDQATTLLIFQVGPYSFCVSALEVESIISPPPITTIPFAPKSVAGSCLFHGKVALVISLHQKFGLKRNSDNNNDQLIVTQLKSGLAAFRVDAVHDVTTLTDLQLEKISTAHSNSVFDHFLLQDGHVILHTNFEALYNLPDAKHVDDVLASLTPFGKKPKTTVKKDTIHTDPTSTTENDQLKSDSVLGADRLKDHHLANSNLESPSDIFDFETILPSQEKLTSPSSNPIDYSVDEHDAFDLSQTDKRAQNNLARRTAPKNPSTKPEKDTGISPREKMGSTITPATQNRFFGEKTGSPYQARTNSANSRRNNMTGLLCLTALLLAFTGAFFLWPSRPEQKKAAYHQKTYQVVAEKRQTKKEFHQDAKKYPPSKATENEEVLLSPSQNNTTGKIEHETVMQPPTSDTPPDGETETAIQPPAETAFVEIEAETLKEQPTKSEPAFITKETIVTPTPFAEPEIVEPGDIASDEEQSTPHATPNEKGEIYRVENKDFALIVERPTGKDFVIDEAPKKKKIFQEFIHIVIKGDTLWAIAKKYLGDPFLYNKLAENSAIKNPNLIYPGDRVRIIKKLHNR